VNELLLHTKHTAAALPKLESDVLFLQVASAVIMRLYLCCCRDPEKVALAYTEDSEWRNRGEFIKGRDAIREVCLHCHMPHGNSTFQICTALPVVACTDASALLHMVKHCTSQQCVHPLVLRSVQSTASDVASAAAAVQFLRRKWAREHDYKLRKYLWACRDNRISVCFEYEYRDDR
jgi:nuclear transport factor 2 (NTF2) superfamily protein